MKKDKDHCIICGSVHYWAYGSFSDGNTKRMSIYYIACGVCHEKVKNNEVSDGAIDIYWNEAVKILDK